MLAERAVAQPAAPANQLTRLTLETKDGVQLHCRYYPSSLGASAIPVILIHGWKEQASNMSGLAKYLNSNEGGNLAVVVPDLRGHGGSTQQTLKDNPKQAARTLSADKIRRADFDAIVMYDLEAIKTFLIEQHNQRRLNIDMLSVVGTEMGALAGMYWTTRDWDWPPIRGLRQGQDVKALVLISPLNSFKGVSTLMPLKHAALKSRVAVQLIYGKNGSGIGGTARRITSILEKNRDRALPLDDQALNTTLQGTSLIGEDALRVDQLVAHFLKQCVAVHKDDFPWKARGTNMESE